jgi:lysophospholipid acyltransferase (LPLAT)-like uncharacterized protein
MVLWLITTLARLFLAVVCETIYTKEIGFDLVKKYLASPQQSAIFAFWHNRIFYLTYYFAKRFIRQGFKPVVLSSLSRDGEIMARLESKLGAFVVRGSSSRRGRQGLLELYRLARPAKNGQPSGFSPVITVDGPRGPKYEIQPGIILIAQKTGLPIIPISYQVTRSYIFNSWDNFILPLPFARVTVHYGKPIIIPGNLTKTETAQLKHELKQELLKISGESIDN